VKLDITIQKTTETFSLLKKLTELLKELVSVLIPNDNYHSYLKKLKIVARRTFEGTDGRGRYIVAPTKSPGHFTSGRVQLKLIKGLQLRPSLLPVCSLRMNPTID
jgi:hypothetical protein